jgi:hypothetical protein
MNELFFRLQLALDRMSLIDQKHINTVAIHQAKLKMVEAFAEALGKDIGSSLSCSTIEQHISYNYSPKGGLLTTEPPNPS